MNVSHFDASIYSRAAALRKKESLRTKVNTNKKYTLWTALEEHEFPNSNNNNEQTNNTSGDDHQKEQSCASAPPFIDLGSGDEVVPSDFRKKIGAMCLLFLDLSDDCHKNARPIVKDFLKKMDEYEVPARTIIIPVQQHNKSAIQPQITQEEYEQIIDDLPGGLVLPSCNDPRAHILSSFREVDAEGTLPILTTFDSAGNRLNNNAFYEMFEDLQNQLRNFPYRTNNSSSSSMSVVKLFRSEYVDPELLEFPCICLYRLSSTTSPTEQEKAKDEVIVEESKNLHAISLLFSNAAKQYRTATGENNKLRFFQTRTRDETFAIREADKCRNGHPLVRRGAFDTTQCNGCAEKSTQNMACASCGFDLCQKCFDEKLQIPHPDVLLMILICEEFARASPQRLSVVGWNYQSGVFAAMSIKHDKTSDEELFAFFQKIERAK